MTNIKEGFANSFISEKRLWKKVKTGYTHFAEGDIGIAKITPCFENKKSVVFKGLINQYGAGTTELHIIRCFPPCLLAEFLLLFAKNDSFIAGGIKTFAGDVGQQRVTKDYIGNYLFPMPPYSEQSRIVDSVNTSFSIINTIDDSKIELDETINILKTKILELAIQGKLVPQNPEEEPASALLERIHAEKEELIRQGKIKRDKNKSIIFKSDDNSYYGDIPDSWAIASFSYVATLISGRDLKSEEYNAVNNGIPYITGASNFINNQLIINRWTEHPRVVSNLNDILITCKGTIGELAVNNVGKVHIARQIMAIRVNPNISIEYMKLFFMAIINDIKNAAGGLIPGISRKDILDLEIPIPPSNEQKRIVKTVQFIFTILETI